MRPRPKSGKAWIAPDGGWMLSLSLSHPTMRILSTMWISFIFGAAAGAVVVSSFHRIGLWGILLPLTLLIVAEVKAKLLG